MHVGAILHACMHARYNMHVAIATDMFYIGLVSVLNKN